MHKPTNLVIISGAVASALFAISFNATAAVDVEAAKNLARANNCFKCHGETKDKDGPSFVKMAEKYRGKAEAEAKLSNHLISGEKAKFADGHEEPHKVINTKDAAQIKNLVNWILSVK
jgi:cytochrome c